MVSYQSRQIHLVFRPKGLPNLADFKLIDTPTPQTKEGEMLVHTSYLSVDPYMCGCSERL